MRTTLLSILAVAPLVSAQQLPEDAARQKRLDAALANWAQAMAAVQSLEAKLERTSEDRVFQTKETYRGTARFLRSGKPNERSRASLYLQDVTQPKKYEQFILTPEFLFEASPATQEIRAHELPKALPGQNVDNNLVGLLFGMSAADAKKRYDITLAAEDANFIVLDIKSRSARDKADFSEARLHLRAADSLPRRLMFKQVNGNTVVWDLPEITTPANLRPADFDAPPLPQGWKFTRVPLKSP